MRRKVLINEKLGSLDSRPSLFRIHPFRPLHNVCITETDVDGDGDGDEDAKRTKTTPLSNGGETYTSCNFLANDRHMTYT